MSEIKFDERGREILSDMPSHFVVPTQKRISTLDFHRQRLLEQREMMFRMMQEMREDSEYESFKDANDFDVEDDFDEEIHQSDYELSDDGLDGLEALARQEYSRILATPVAETSVKSNENHSE